MDILLAQRQVHANRGLFVAECDIKGFFDCVAHHVAERALDDGDLALVDLNQMFELRREDLLDRHKLSPYVGRTFRGVTRRTILRGRTIFLDGKIIGAPGGRFVRPTR